MQGTEFIYPAYNLLFLSTFTTFLHELFKILHTEYRIVNVIEKNTNMISLLLHIGYVVLYVFTFSLWYVELFFLFLM